VIAQDRLDLLAAIAFRIDLVGPLDELDVHGGPRPLEQTVVDGVAHQVVIEAIAWVRVVRCRVNEVLARQRPKLIVELRPDLLRCQRLDCGARELHSDDRSGLRRRPFGAFESVEAGLQQRTDRRRDDHVDPGLGAHRRTVGTDGTTVHEHRQHLLDIERIAHGSRDDLSNKFFRQAGCSREVAHYLCCILVRKRIKHEPGRPFRWPHSARVSSRSGVKWR
jgi:hypothetical protein